MQQAGALLPEPWDKDFGRPRALDLTDAVVACLMYIRQNMTQEVIADFFGTCQSVVSEAVITFTPLIEQVTAPLVPTVEDAVAACADTVVLIDGALWPCWSWAHHRELWAGKYKTTGNGSLIVSSLVGKVCYVSDPVAGKNHDMAKIDEDVERILKAVGDAIGDKGFIGREDIIAPVRKPANGELSMNQKVYNSRISSLRAPVERAIAHLKNWKILFTDYRRPLETFATSFKAAIGLYFLTQTI